MNAKVIHGDCLEVMRDMDANSVDAIVTDPPYGLEFMGKDWDKLGAGVAECRDSMDESHPFRDGSTRVRYGKNVKSMQEWHYRWAVEALRVAKPGAHLLAFGGTRTHHRLMCAIEDAGWEIRDCLCWVTGQGFPKNTNISKQLDKLLGKERDVITQKIRGDVEKAKLTGTTYATAQANRNNKSIFGYGIESITAPASEPAKQWDGFGTALKPSLEIIVLCRKPLTGTIAQNVLRWGCGGLNIDSCRIPLNGDYKCGANGRPSLTGLGDHYNPEEANQHSEIGRWPANLLHDNSPAVLECFPKSTSSGGQASLGAFRNGDIYGKGRDETEKRDPGYGDTGSAARFFQACPYGEEDFAEAKRLLYFSKASKADRDEGLDGFESRTWQDQGYRDNATSHLSPRAGAGRTSLSRNHHPTVKSTSLMKYLVRLITPPGGLVLDPFCGSGSTGKAAILEGFQFIGIEQEAEYVAIAEARIAHAIKTVQEQQPSLF